MRVTWALAAATAVLTLLAAVQVLRTVSGSPVGDPANFVPPAMTAFAVLAAVFVVGLSIRRAELALHRWFPWLIGAMSLALALVPWLLLTFGRSDAASMLYRGLRIPQGIERFWDLALVLRSIDCDAAGFDVFAQNNGCLQDPAIYGPGMLWLQHVPFGLVSFSHVLALGVAGMVVSSFALVWLARQSSGLGQLVLLVAAVGSPWLLLLERGNVDAALVWLAVVAVILVRRRPTLLSWSVVALLIWLVGTWKYYPFAMGLMLIPVLRLRRGWIVLAAWAVASFGYVLLTWTNFRFSMQSNTNMTEIGDYVVLGRAPVVARMIGSEFPARGIQWGDVLIVAIALAAMAWGALLGWRSRGKAVHPAMLAAAGSAIFLASVLVGGFGWAYKAVFLLLAVPLLSWLASRAGRLHVGSGVVMLVLVAVCSVVVWNTLLASLAGIVAASFALGLAGSVLVRSTGYVQRS